MKKRLTFLLASMVVLSLVIPTFARGNGAGNPTEQTTTKRHKTKSTKTNKTNSHSGAGSSDSH
jgi:hypothetical protein